MTETCRHGQCSAHACLISQILERLTKELKKDGIKNLETDYTIVGDPEREFVVVMRVKKDLSYVVTCSRVGDGNDWLLRFMRSHDIKYKD